MTYTLSISTDYVSAWGAWEAVRELLQNSIDQTSELNDSKMIFSHNGDRMMVGATNCRLKPQTLLMGVSSKRNDINSIGQFGEGYKLALLVLARMGCKVTIKNGPDIWTPVIEMDEKYGAEVLKVKTRKGNPNDNDVIYRIEGIDIPNLDELYLPNAPTVLHDRPGQIYVGGLYVCTVQDLDNGYNFPPNKLRLGRDRMMASTFDIQWETSRLLAADKNLYTKLKSEKGDLRYADSHITPEDAEAVLAHYEAEHGDAIPVSCQAEIDEAGGGAFQLVPRVLMNILKSVKSFVTKIISPKQRLQLFYDKHGSTMSAEAQEDLQVLINSAGGWS